MARKARQRISYVLPLANSPGGHRLGVNGLAVDSKRSILYSGGRDGVICAWNLNLDLSQPSSAASNPFVSPEDPRSSPTPKTQTSTSFRQQVQAHTHWVNDVVLVQSDSALVSASSDITVKVWRPHAEDGLPPQTIGIHNDYVKCVATPGSNSDWVASGGFDQKICLWDLTGGGEKLRINVGEDESRAKGSVYALRVRGSILASGGPESIVRVWDPKSGKRVTKFVGHTDNVRDILINQDGDMIMTASSDQTVKVWSMAAGRCMHTLTMHNDSVWSLFSNHPQLSVFYSGDRSGLVAKTDVRGCADMDEGRCVAVCQEHEGVNKVVCAGDYIWTSTSSSSINRWKDVDTEAEVQMSDAPRHYRGSSGISRSKVSPSPPPPPPRNPLINGTGEKQLPLSSLLRLSNTAAFPGLKTRDAEAIVIHSGSSMRKPSEAILDTDLGVIIPIHELPEETIEGQSGLIKHLLLNDRKRVLTLDTAGEVMMWDLLECVPIKSYGKRHLEDVAPEVNTTETLANWCAVDTRTGRLACVLEENHCFDAEMYADELELEESLHFREDQRINLGKWVLRYLFADLIDEEIRRDEAYRKNLTSHTVHPTGLQRGNAPPSIQLPETNPSDWHELTTSHDPAATPRATNCFHYPAMTPGLSIGVATPYLPPSSQGSHANNLLPSTLEEGVDLEKRMSHQSQPGSSSDRSNDYFSTRPGLNPASETDGKMDGAPNGAHVESLQSTPDLPPDKEEKTKEGSSLFGKKFRMNFPKKLGRSSMDSKPAVVDEKSEESSDKSSEKEDRIVEENFFGVIQKIRYEYDERLQTNPGQPLTSSINPSSFNETPVLRPPRFTTVIIQEDRPDSGGVADVFRGTVGSLGQEADQIEKVAPMWLGELLLRNQIPAKEIVKVSFVLQPYQDLLPSIASADGNSRLNANRMLRGRKILAYVAERIEPQTEHQDSNALKPEEYLELYCQNQLVPPTMTLATIRTHIWKTGGDVMLYYKANGRKRILGDRSAVLGSGDTAPQSYAEAAPSEFR